MFRFWVKADPTTTVYNDGLIFADTSKAVLQFYRVKQSSTLSISFGSIIIT